MQNEENREYLLSLEFISHDLQLIHEGDLLLWENQSITDKTLSFPQETILFDVRKEAFPYIRGILEWWTRLNRRIYKTVFVKRLPGIKQNCYGLEDVWLLAQDACGAPSTYPAAGLSRWPTEQPLWPQCGPRYFGSGRTAIAGMWLLFITRSYR